MWANAQAHPFQTALGAVAGGLVPGGGLIAGRLFGMYNNNQMNNQVNNSAATIGQQGQMAGDNAMNAPLNGPLGQFGNSDGTQTGNNGVPTDSNGVPIGGSFGPFLAGYQQPNAPTSDLGLVPDYSSYRQQDNSNPNFVSNGAKREYAQDNGGVSSMYGQALPGGGGTYGSTGYDPMNGASNQMRSDFAAAMGGDPNGLVVYHRRDT